MADIIVEDSYEKSLNEDATVKNIKCKVLSNLKM